MCGIAGIAGPLAPEVLTCALEAMLAAQVHRGPDDCGVQLVATQRGAVALGNRRLAILDLSPAGHQPMVNPETGDVLVHNGEIYNCQELRAPLAQRGHRFMGSSDTEVLLFAYQEWGMKCLGRLRGMFAFALWDARRGRLVLARDPLGIKPLYYAALPGGGMAFASEVKGLVAGGLIPGSLERRALAGYLAYGSVQEPLTIIQGVLALPAGAWMEAEGDGQIAAQGRHWNMPQPDPALGKASADQLTAQGLDLLKTAVSRHLLSDVPVGTLLSSGLDSTALLALARQASSEVHAFTVSFPDAPDLDEGPMARSAAQRLGAPCHQCPVDGATALLWATEGLKAMDQPSMDGLNTYIVSRAIRDQGIAVALSGQGGDEVFGGYRSFREVPRWYQRMGWLGALPASGRRGLAAVAARRMDQVAKNKAQDLAAAGHDLARLYFQFRRLLSDADLIRLGLRADDLGLESTFQTRELDTASGVIEQDPIATVGRLEIAFYLKNTLLRDGDVFGMANSLEIRVPFLDLDLVEWVMRLPGPALLPAGAANKFLLRRMCAQYFTPEQAGQAKRGFTLPFSAWLLGPLKETMTESLASLKSSGLLAPAGIDQVRDMFLQEPHSAAWSRVWALVTLGHWVTRLTPVAPPAVTS